jgi:magnesium chelatase family protein
MFLTGRIDRIDIHVEVPPVKYRDLSGEGGEKSSVVRERVLRTRTVQRERFLHSRIHRNADMKPSHLRKFCRLGREEKDLLESAMAELNFSARAYDRIIKVSRTIADLEGSPGIGAEHLSEAIQYRVLDRKFWL